MTQTIILLFMLAIIGIYLNYRVSELQYAVDRLDDRLAALEGADDDDDYHDDWELGI